MSRSTRILFLSATLGALVALAGCSQADAPAPHSVSPVAATTSAQAAANDSPAPTHTGQPASFVTLQVTYPQYCAQGTTVQPTLSWTAANTVNVAVSVDQPSTVGGFGFFGPAASLPMPSIVCTGAVGEPVPAHEYEIDAIGTNYTRLHLVEKVTLTVGPNLTTTTTNAGGANAGDAFPASALR